MHLQGSINKPLGGAGSGLSASRRSWSGWPWCEGKDESHEDRGALLSSGQMVLQPIVGVFMVSRSGGSANSWAQQAVAT